MPFFPMTPRRTAALHGIGQWLGEAVIGVIPLIVYVLVHRYSTLPITATCQGVSRVTNPPILAGCLPIIDSPSQEICILAVVISGLAVLSVVPLIRERPRQITGFTRLLILLALVSLIFGSLFYALFTAHLDKNADTITYYILGTALISSLCLSIEGAILAA